MTTFCSCIFRLDHRGFLFATPPAKIRRSDASGVIFAYISEAPIPDVDEREFNKFMEGYEFATVVSDDNELIITDTSRAPMRLVHEGLSASCKPYVVDVSDTFRAQFPRFPDHIKMVVSVQFVPAIMSENPMSEAELAKCKIADGSIPDNGYVFPILVAGSRVPDDEEGRAIPPGYNNYAIVRARFLWSLRWPVVA
jgi:hypothetical protein